MTAGSLKRPSLTAVLIDDEQDSLEGLEILLKTHCPDVRVMALCPGAEQGIQAIERFHPDVVFLDIEMPGMNGFDLLEQLDEISFDIIFITAYDEFAIQAIKVSAMDYLLKPVQEDELVNAVEKVAHKKHEQVDPRVDVLLTNLKGGDQSFTKIALPTIDGLDFINTGDILHCQSDGNYTSIYTDQGERYVISRTLKEFEEMLSSPLFFRTHQSHLVNLNKIKKYVRGSGGEVILVDGTHIQVARSRKEPLLQKIYNKS